MGVESFAVFRILALSMTMFSVKATNRKGGEHPAAAGRRNEGRRPPVRIGYIAATILIAACDQEAVFVEQVAILDSIPMTFQGSYEPCRVPEGRSGVPLGEDGAIIMVTVKEPLRCHIARLPAHAVLAPSAEELVPDPYHPIVRMDDGSWITATSARGKVLKWSPEGQFVSQYGAVGSGPGEFTAAGDLILVRASGDSVFVVDDAGRWTLLAGDLTYGRSFEAGFELGRHYRYLHVLDDGSILNSQSRRPHENAFRITADGGQHLLSFGPFGPDVDPQERYPVFRATAYSGGETFWAAPPDGYSRPLTIEEWTTDGRLVRRFERDQLTLEASSERTAPWYVLMNVDDSGLLWYAVVTLEPTLSGVSDGARRPATREDSWTDYDLLIEVLDPRTGEIVASSILDDPSPPFIRMYPGTRTFSRVIEDSFGLQTVEFFDMTLVASR